MQDRKKGTNNRDDIILAESDTHATQTLLYKSGFFFTLSQVRSGENIINNVRREGFNLIFCFKTKKSNAYILFEI